MRSSSHTHGRARALRKSLSPPEAALWARLRGRTPGIPVFRRQHPIGPYIADFYCSAARLVFEIDGATHADDDQIAHDARRDAFMAQRGYHVVRITAGAVMADADGVAQGMVETAIAHGG